MLKLDWAKVTVSKRLRGGAYLAFPLFGELANLLGMKDDAPLSESHRKWVEEILKSDSNKRDAKWTESIAVGDKEFVLETKARLGATAVGRKVHGENDHYELRETQIPYTPL